MEPYELIFDGESETANGLDTNTFFLVERSAVGAWLRGITADPHFRIRGGMTLTGSRGDSDESFLVAEVVNAAAIEELVLAAAPLNESFRSFELFGATEDGGSAFYVAGLAPRMELGPAPELPTIADGVRARIGMHN